MLATIIRNTLARIQRLKETKEACDKIRTTITLAPGAKPPIARYAYSCSHNLLARDYNEKKLFWMPRIKLIQVDQSAITTTAHATA